MKIKARKGTFTTAAAKVSNLGIPPITFAGRASNDHGSGV